MTKYTPITMIGTWYYNQSGVTELLIMKILIISEYGRMCFKSFKTLGTFLPFHR